MNEEEIWPVRPCSLGHVCNSPVFFTGSQRTMIASIIRVYFGAWKMGYLAPLNLGCDSNLSSDFEDADCSDDDDDDEDDDDDDGDDDGDSHDHCYETCVSQRLKYLGRVSN